MNTKSFLLGCAGALIALTGAQAADLPIKAKPVAYVKICSLYGAGYYYIPGTDTCIKVGGYVRAQAEWQSDNGFSYGSTNLPIAEGRFDRVTDDFNITGRGAISADARTQTEFGTLRSYIRIGAQSNGRSVNSFFADRLFIQIAGFTMGRAQSFFDIFSNTETFSYIDSKTSGDTYNTGAQVMAYTASFGNGLSATISAEQRPNPTGVVDGATGAWGVNGVTTLDSAGMKMPDLVGNVRLDQAWGYAGVSGALHQVAGNYYGSGIVPGNGHPADKVGWAVQVGGMAALPGDNSIGASFVATKGAIGYATKAGNWQMYNGNSVGIGWGTDGIFDNLTGQTPILLTNAWSVNAGVEHMWNRRWRTSVYGGYTKVYYDGDAVDLINRHLPGAAGTRPCGVPVAGAVWPPVNVAVGSNNSCSPDFSYYQIGTRTQWDVAPGFYVGLDVFYTHLNTAYKGTGAFLYTNPIPVTAVDDQSSWSVILRAQRDF